MRTTEIFLSLLAALSLPACLAPTRSTTYGDMESGTTIHDDAARSGGEATKHTVADRPPEPPGAVDVEEAVRIALHYHPDIAAARARVDAATGRKLQAGRLPNPVFSAYMESASLEGKTTGDAEYPVGVTQRVPLGGRLGAGVRVEDARVRRVLHELDEKRRVVERRVRGAFAAALFAGEALSVERRLLEGAEEAARIARERVGAGDASSGERARAELEAVRARISVSRAELAERRALSGLEAAISYPTLFLSELEGSLESALSLPQLETVLATLDRTPLLRARTAAIEESQARLLREEARRIPDIDIGFFYRRVEQTGSDAFDVGFSIPLPLFDRRGGALQEARAQLTQARALRTTTEMNLATRVKTTYWNLKQALETARLFRDEISPRSEVVLEAAEERYRSGDTSLAELIPIRRDHRELELSYLDLLRQTVLDGAELRSLVASENTLGGE